MWRKFKEYINSNERYDFLASSREGGIIGVVFGMGLVFVTIILLLLFFG